MIKLKNIFIIVLAVFVTACTVDPLKDIEGSTDWQKERNINSILLEGQIGTAIIERTADAATIKVFGKLANIADITKVEIIEIDYAYGASSEKVAGSTLDLSSGTSTIEVKSGAGETLNWTVVLEPFQSDLEGVWYIAEMAVYCDMFTWESWGWEKTEKINNYLPEAEPELDNTITFTVEGADASGNPFGNYENNAGADGEYGNFGDAAKGWDFNERLRKMPKGKGTWLRDFARNKVIITDENQVATEFDLELFLEDKQVSLKTELPYLADQFNWTDTDWALEEVSKMSNPMWYKLSRDKVLQTGNDIKSFWVENQVGDAQFNWDAKEIVVTIPDDGTNVSAIKIAGLSISYAATASLANGDVLDFSNGMMTQIAVTSEAGEEAIWTIKLRIEIDPSEVTIAGTWSVGEIGVYCDLFTWESWGWDKSEKLNNYLPLVGAELDNTITFTVEGKNASGQPYGTFDHSAGADENFGDFRTEDASWPETDFNSRFRKVPTGAGTWVQVDDKLVLTDAGSTEFQLTLEIKTESEIALTTELEYKNDLFNWTNTNYSYEEVAHMSKKMWNNLNKQ